MNTVQFVSASILLCGVACSRDIHQHVLCKLLPCVNVNQVLDCNYHVSCIVFFGHLLSLSVSINMNVKEYTPRDQTIIM